MTISPEALAQYKATARERWKAREEARAVRLLRAQQVAREAAAYLKEAFGATRVVAFGSLVHGDHFGEWSDIDLAV